MLTIRRLLAFTLILAALAFAPAVALAQQNAAAVPVTLTGARGDPGVNIATTATSATTLTLTPAVGEYVYVYSVHVSNCAGASAVTAAAVTTITTTAIGGGTTPAWTIGSGVSAGLCTQVFTDTYPTGLKGNGAGTAVTFVTPTYATNQTIRLVVVWRSAP
mgnify:CR=1 FL=1